MIGRDSRVAGFLLVAGVLVSGLVCKKNQPPEVASVPSGPSSGRRGDTLRFKTIVEDPNGDSVSARFDWGDSTMSDWSSFVPSGDSVVLFHAWQRLGTYRIRAQARNSRGDMAVWSGASQLTVASFVATLADSLGGALLSVQQTTDGGYITAGVTNSLGAGADDAFLVKFDGSGYVVWSRAFGGARQDLAYSVEQTTDGGYILAGITSSYREVGSDVYLVKTDDLGDQIWFKTFAVTSGAVGNSVCQTTDGGYVIAGYDMPPGEIADQLYVIKTDASGVQVWSRCSDWGRSTEGYSVQQTSDGGYVVTGNMDPDSSGPSGAWLVKLDASGDRLWDGVFGPPAYRGESVRQTTDGGYVVAGYGGGRVDAGFLIKTDSLGDLSWDRTYEDSGICQATWAEQTSDGGYIFTGYLWSGTNLKYYSVLVKTGASGDIVWLKRLCGSDDDQGFSVRQTGDGGYVTCGYSDSLGGAYLIKTDANGN